MLHSNGATYIRALSKTILVSCSGQGTSMEVKQKVCDLFNNLYILIGMIGLGLHLKSVAASLPPRFDLHELHRLLTDLTEYDHLKRIFRLCYVHVERNIKISSVPESVKTKMRSLICMTHRNFEGTLDDITREGGKKGSGTHLKLFESILY